MPLKQQSGRLPTGSTRRWMDDNLSRSRRLVYVRDVSAPRQLQKQIVCRERGNFESRNNLSIHGSCTKRSSYIQFNCESQAFRSTRFAENRRTVSFRITECRSDQTASGSQPRVTSPSVTSTGETTGQRNGAEDDPRLREYFGGLHVAVRVALGADHLDLRVHQADGHFVQRP